MERNNIPAEYPSKPWQPLFDYLSGLCEIPPTLSEMEDLMNVVEKMIGHKNLQAKCDRYEKALKKMEKDCARMTEGTYNKEPLSILKVFEVSLNKALNGEWKGEKEPAPAVQHGAVWVTGQYGRLYDQLMAEPERKIVCWVDYDGFKRMGDSEPCRDICSIRGVNMSFISRGISYGDVQYLHGDHQRKYFLELCEQTHVQWLDESAGEKEVIDLPAFVQYIRENYKPSKEVWKDRFGIALLSDEGVINVYKAQKEVKDGGI